MPIQTKPTTKKSAAFYLRGERNQLAPGLSYLSRAMGYITVMFNADIFQLKLYTTTTNYIFLESGHRVEIDGTVYLTIRFTPGPHMQKNQHEN